MIKHYVDRGADTLCISGYKGLSKVENKKGGQDGSKGQSEEVHRRGRRRGLFLNLPFCPRTQRCREGWGWPLVGCCTVYYNLLRTFAEISLIRGCGVKECGRDMLSHQKS